MRYRFKYIYLLLPLFLFFAGDHVFGQYPGGVSTGTTRGYKVDYYNGTFTAATGFGAGTTNATPGITGYSNKITNSEYYNIDNSYYGLEYTGILEAPVAGNYTITLSNVDDNAWLYINGTLVAQAAYNNATSTAGAQTVIVTLTLGDNTIKVKTYNGGGNAFTNLQIANGPAGSGITTATDIDGRFVRTDNSKLTAWYKGSDLGVTANYNPGIDKVNTWTNKAPDYASGGTMTYAGTGWAGTSVNSQVNFNPAVTFSGTNRYTTPATQNGISYRGATQTFFGVADYYTNATQVTWLFYHGPENTTANGKFGIYKNSNGVQASIEGGGISTSSTWTAGEPKLMATFVAQATGAAAPSGTNPLQADANGISGTPGSLFSNAVAASGQGFAIGSTSATGANYINGANIPEMIYYPFQLSALQEQKVNTYLAIKYGITMGQDYVNTSGAAIFGLTTNTGYTNRIFGIGRELAVEGLNQLQSQSQSRITSTTGYDFLTLSKGSAISSTNALNLGVLNDGDYLILGDNGGALATQTTQLPAAYTSSCSIARIGRQWKAQVTGNPGPVTILAGSTTAGSFVFPGNVAGVKLIVDTDGDFTTAAGQTMFDAASVTNGVATFNNVTIPNGAVITFAWTVTAPGGVSNGLTHWYNGGYGAYADAAATTAATNNGIFGSWVNEANLADGKLVVGGLGGTAKFYTNGINFNPVWSFNNFAVHNSPGLITPITSTEVSSFLAVTPQTGTNSVHRRFTLKNTGNSNDWDNTNGVLFFTGSGGTITTNRNGLRGNILSPTLGSTPAVFSTLYGLTTTSNYFNGKGAGSSAYASLGNFNANEILLGGTYTSSDGGWSDGSNVEEYYSEAILYNRKLLTNERQQVETYLSIKNGTTLDYSDIINYSQYLSSGGTPIYNYSTYINNIFGIGRDDCSGLNQKQSKSTTGADNVTIGLTAIAATNIANTGSFSANNQFIMVGDDNGALASVTTNIPAAYTTTGCNPVRYARNWKVQNTGGVTAMLQLSVGSTGNLIPGNWNNVVLAINNGGDATFATGATLISATSVNNGVATFNNVNLPNGAVFTVLASVAYPAGVSAPAAGITITTAGGTTSTGNVNGLAYKLYSTNATAGSISAGFGAYTPVLLSTGYYNNATTFQNFVSQKITTNYGIELTGKLNTATSTSYQFRGNAIDEEFALIIDGTVVLNQTAPGTLINSIVLTAGYHDIVIRGRNLGSTQNFDLQWDGGTGASFAAIPDANFFTQPQGPSAWYAADDNALSGQADGTNMVGLKWNDLSVNGNNVTGFGNPTYYSTTATNTGIAGIRNYNPSIYFTADYFGATPYINGFAYGNTGKSLLTVASNNNVANTTYSGFGKDNGTGTNFGLFKYGTPSTFAGKLQLFTGSNDVNDPNSFYNSATYTTDLISGQLTKAGSGSIYGNGLNRFTTTLSTPLFSTQFNDNDQLEVGSAPDYSSVNHTGNMNEVLYYPWDLSATERQKVNSYLAIKWGITLDQSTATNYLASDGSTIWDSGVAATTYINDITGIGRDDCGNLNQKQSTSTDASDIVSIGLGGIAATNAQNTNAFSTNKNFLIFANNAGNFVASTSVPTTADGTECYSRIGRVWQVQSNNVGNVSMQVGKSGLFLFSGANYKPVLLVSTNPTFASSTTVKPTKVVNGVGYFDNVNFASPTMYFTVAYINAAPGGVSTALKVWFNAGYQIFTDAAQANPAATDGNTVASWNNLATSNTVFTKLVQTNATYLPVYRSATFNYNPSVYFSGVGAVNANEGSFLVSPSAFDVNGYRSLNSMTAIIAGANYGTGGQNVFFDHSTTSQDWRTRMERALLTFNYSDPNNHPYNLYRRPFVTVPELYALKININNPTNAVSTSAEYPSVWSLYSNLKNVTDLPLIGSPSTSPASAFTAGTGPLPAYNYTSLFSLGAYSGTAGLGAIKADMGEVITYSDYKNTSDMQKIHSYLAVKYGYTLDATAMSNQYIASDGSTITYNDANYWNRITGIGRDDCTTLDQKQSFSQVAGALVYLSNDPNGLAATNQLNTAEFAKNKTFLLYGDNNKSLTWTGSDNIAYSGTNLMRLNRVWHVKETGLVTNPVGTVFLQVPASTNATATVKLPAPLNSASDPMYMLVANSASNGSFSSPTVVPMIPNGTDYWTVNYDFADGDYYTFATIESCLAPAGITDGLTSWFKTTDLPTGPMAVSTATITDLSGNNNTLTRNATGVATAVAGTGLLYNYNRYVTLATNAAFVKVNSTESQITTTTDGTMFGVSTTSGGLFGLSRFVATDRIGIFAQSAFLSNISANMNGVTGVANVYNMRVSTGTTLSPNTNGASVGTVTFPASALTAGTNYTTAIGFNANAVTYNNQGFAEAFSFNRTLATYELQVLDSYLAVKYGQTLSHNYFNPGYNGSNAASMTLYDISTYPNRVLGVGNDVKGCFNQNQSTSSLAGSLLKISVDGVINVENSQSPTSWNSVDRAYIVLGDDNGNVNFVTGDPTQPGWIATSRPSVFGGNTCVRRITRQWKATTTNTVPSLLVTIPDNTSAATTKLDAVPAGNDVYMVVSDQADFTSATATQQAVKMTLNTTTKEWEGNVALDPNVTRYITFAYVTPTCGLTCIPVNPSTSRIKLK